MIDPTMPRRVSDIVHPLLGRIHPAISTIEPFHPARYLACPGRLAIVRGLAMRRYLRSMAFGRMPDDGTRVSYCQNCHPKSDNRQWIAPPIPWYVGCWMRTIPPWVSPTMSQPGQFSPRCGTLKNPGSGIGTGGMDPVLTTAR